MLEKRTELEKLTSKKRITALIGVIDVLLLLYIILALAKVI